MKQRGILILVLIALLLSGCWNRRELNDLAIAVGYGIDKAGSQYHVSIQVVDPGEVAAKKGASGRTPVTLFHTKGPTVFEALRKMTTVSPRKIYNSHLRILVIGEDLAREGIGNVLDFLSRDHELRTDFFIVVAKGTHSAEEALKILTSIEKIPASHMFNSLKASAKAWAPSITVTLDQLISDLVSQGKHPVLTGVELKGDQQIGETRNNVEEIGTAAFLQYTGLAVFKKDKLIGWLNEEESKGNNFIVDEVKSTVGHLACPGGGKLALEVIRSQTKMKGKMENGKPKMDIDTRIEVNVGEVACNVDLTKTDTIYELERISEQAVKALMEKSVHKAQNKYKVDIFGFGEAIHRAEPEAWKTLKKNWDEHFTKMPVSIKVDTKIRRLGTVSNSFLQEMKKK